MGHLQEIEEVLYNDVPDFFSTNFTKFFGTIG